LDRHDSVIFDLDGTLWDASATSADGWNQVLDDLAPGYRRVSADDIRAVAGMPFRDCVQKLFGDLGSGAEEFCGALDESERRAIDSRGGALFDGVSSGIPLLAKQLDLFLVSNCQSWYLEAFWTHSELRSYFRGSDCHGRSSMSKARMISALVQRYTLKAPVYIGDTAGDEEASAAAGVPFGHVSYGFGVAANPKHRYESFTQLVESFPDVA
jgi:phosphoglycolate phosphatase